MNFQFYYILFLIIEYGTLQEGSLSSTNSLDKCNENENQKEDLYFWMAKQQESKQRKDSTTDKVIYKLRKKKNQNSLNLYSNFKGNL